MKFCEVSRNPISNWTWKFQRSILKNKKVLFLKKIFFGRCQYQNKKALFTDSIFQKVLIATTKITGSIFNPFICQLTKNFQIIWRENEAYWNATAYLFFIVHLKVTLKTWSDYLTYWFGLSSPVLVLDNVKCFNTHYTPSSDFIFFYSSN